MLVAFIIGFLFGFIGSIPVAGPISVLIFARCIEDRYDSATLIGLGSVIAETLYAFFAFWGFAILLDRYPWIEPISGGAAAIILLALGFIFWRGQKPAEPDAEAAVTKPGSGWKSFALGFSISGFNPTLLATWAGAAGTLSASGLVEFNETLAWPFGIGAGVGIGCWYLILVRLIQRYKGRFKPETLNNVLKFFGVFLAIIGLWFAIRFVGYLTTTI